MPISNNMAHAQVSEPVVKAAFLFNFAKFTSWPPPKWNAEQTMFNMCIQDGSLDDMALQQLTGKSVNDIPIEIILFTNTDRLSECHLIYVSEGVPEQAVRTVIELSMRHSILTISDLSPFARNGGMIALIKRDGKIRFEVNLEAARNGSITFSSKLLSLATII